MRLRHLIAATLLAAPALFAQQPLPTAIDVPQGAKVLLTATGVGVQIYSCTDQKWTLRAPQADLLDPVSNRKLGTHFAGPTWQLTDGSQVRGRAIGSRPSPQPGSAAWLLVQAVPGTGTGKLANVTYIRRTDVKGGAAPHGACTGDSLSVHYRATYTFYTGQ